VKFLWANLPSDEAYGLLKASAVHEIDVSLEDPCVGLDAV